MASISKHPNGRYRARYRDAEGKAHERHFRRRVDARAWLDEVTTARMTGRYVDPAGEKQSLAQFYPEFRGRQTWAAGTVQVADRAMRSCTFADVPFRKLRRSHVEAWVKAMSGELAPSTVRTRFNYVGIVIRGAVADRVLAEDVTKGVNLPPVRRREIAMELPTTDQVGRVLEAADEHWATLFTLCAFAGLRLGEAAGVQAGDIQFPTRTLRVRRQVQRKRSGEVEIKAPKAGSERDVNLPDELLAILSEHLRRGVLGEAQWLFVGPHGNPPDRGTVNYWWRKATAAAGVDFHLHALRHFYASALIDAGCSVVTVQRALGHANPTITLNVYSHLFPSMEDPAQTAAADLMTKVLRRPVGNSWATEDLTPY